MWSQVNPSNTIAVGTIMAKYAGFVAGMMVLSSFLSVIFVFLTKAFPKCVVYSMIVLTFIIYIVLIILGFIVKNIGLSVVFIIVLLLNAIILVCYWSYIKIGIILIQCAGMFITEKPAVYFISGMCLLLNIVFSIFWIFAWLGVYSKGVV